MMGAGGYNSYFSFKNTAEEDQEKRWESPCLVVCCTVVYKGLGRDSQTAVLPCIATSFSGGGRSPVLLCWNVITVWSGLYWGTGKLDSGSLLWGGGGRLCFHPYF